LFLPHAGWVEVTLGNGSGFCFLRRLPALPVWPKTIALIWKWDSLPESSMRISMWFSLQPKPGLFRLWQKLFRILSADYKDDLVGDQNELRALPASSP
jgi:hypothetical protein